MTDKGLREALASRGYTLGADGEVDQARAAVELMSKRAALVNAAQARAEAAWRAGHPGQEPSRRVAHGWHHQAWEQTRRPKPKLKEGPAELAERVRLELAEAGFDFTPGRYRGEELQVVAPSVAQVDRDGVAGEVVAALSAARSAWSGAELTTATERALARTGVVGDAQAVAELAEDLRARAEAGCTSVLVGDEKVPSVMSRHLTSVAVIDADMALNLGLAGLAGEQGLRATEAALAARATGLDAGQAEAVAAIAGGAGLEVVIGPAGTGKTAMLAAAQAALPPRAGSWWCWPPPARLPRWPPRNWGPRPRRCPSCSTTTAGAGTTSAVTPAPPSSPASLCLPRARPTRAPVVAFS